VQPLTAVVPAADVRLAVVLVALAATAAVTSRVGHLGVAREQVAAAVRAVVQLAVVATLITAVVSSVAFSLVFVTLMYVVASATSLRRVGAPGRDLPWVGLALAAGAVPVVALCLGSGLVPLNGVGVIPIAGILIGGSMTAATLSGRRAFAELSQHMGIYEAGLALGMRSADAATLVIEPTAREALTPGLDQTRTVGLVTLPGAFVGVLLGGGSATDAAAAQVLVLVGLLAAQAITTVTLVRLIAAGRVVRRDLRDRYPR
jgi:putative ABC transport system permease protein